jgi:hypothetical protein
MTRDEAIRLDFRKMWFLRRLRNSEDCTLFEKALHLYGTRDTNQVVAAPRKRKSKGVRHHVHAVSLSNISEAITRAAGDPPVQQMTNGQLLFLVANIIKLEAERVQGIVR